MRLSKRARPDGDRGLRSACSLALRAVYWRILPARFRRGSLDGAFQQRLVMSSAHRRTPLARRHAVIASKVACEVAGVVATDPCHYFLHAEKRALEQYSRAFHALVAHVAQRRQPSLRPEEVREARRRKVYRRGKPVDVEWLTQSLLDLRHGP